MKRLTLAQWHETFSNSMLALKPTELHFELYHPLTSESAFLNLKTEEEADKFLRLPLAATNLRQYFLKHGVMICPEGPKVVTNGIVA